MPADKRARTKLKDLNEKLHGAEEAAHAKGAGALEKADLKLHEQEVVAEKLKAKRPAPSTEDPSSVDGKRMPAHEPTHVVQQREGPVDGIPAPGGIKSSDPGDRFEREAVATSETAMSSSPPGAHLSASPPAVQRAEMPAATEENEETQEGKPAEGSLEQGQDAAEVEEETAESGP